MKAISLFSGMGGDTLGMENAGVDVVAFSEINKDAVATHLANFNGKLIGDGDITKTTDEELSEYKGVDIIFAGFPCQGFSHAGKKLPDDPRNTLFREFLRAAKIIDPSIIIGENVKGLLKRVNVDGDLYIDIICDEFKKLGYDVRYGLIRAHEHGVPQKRERLFIVGTKSKNPLTVTEKNGTPFIDLPTEKPVGLQDIIEPTLDGALAVDCDWSKVKTIKKASGDTGVVHDYVVLKQAKKESHYFNSKSGKYEYGNKQFDNLFSFAKRESPIHCEIADTTKPTKTIICTYGHQPRLLVAVTDGKTNYVRPFTINELKMIQSFPSDFVMCGKRSAQINQIGNAVAPKVCEKLTKILLDK